MRLLISLTALWSGVTFGAGFPRNISFEFSQGTNVHATGGPMIKYQGGNAYMPVYSLRFFNTQGVATEAEVTLTWDWPTTLSFTFLNKNVGRTCYGNANLNGTEYFGSMNCPSGLWQVKLR